MPDPGKNESKQDYLRRCTKELIDKEGKKPDQAFAQCNSYWEEAKSANAIQLRRPLELTMPVELTRKDDQSGGEITGFLIVGYTGQVIDFGWMGKYIFDTAGIRLEPKMPVLREHNRDRIVGTGTKQWKKDNNIFVQGKFSQSTQDGQEVKNLAEEGYPWQASIGIWPEEVKLLRDEKEKEVINGIEVQGPMEIWTKSHIRETSFVSLGADDQTAGISITLSDPCPVEVRVEYNPTEKQTEEEKPMETQKILEQLAQAKDLTPELLAEHLPKMADHFTNEGKESAEQGFIKSGTERERDRVVEILEAGAGPETTMKAIKDGTEANEFYKLAWKARKETQTKELDDFKTGAAGDVVPKEPKEPQTQSGKSPEEEVAEKAAMLAEEKGISTGEATALVLEKDPELAKRYYGSYEMPTN